MKNFNRDSESSSVINRLTAWYWIQDRVDNSTFQWEISSFLKLFKVKVTQHATSTRSKQNHLRDAKFLSNFQGEAHDSIRIMQVIGGASDEALSFIMSSRNESNPWTGNVKHKAGRSCIPRWLVGGKPSGIVSNWKSAKPLRESNPLELSKRW